MDYLLLASMVITTYAVIFALNERDERKAMRRRLQDEREFYYQRGYDAAYRMAQRDHDEHDRRWPLMRIDELACWVETNGTTQQRQLLRRVASRIMRTVR